MTGNMCYLKLILLECKTNMEYSFTDKRYCITFVNEDNEIKKLIYKIVDTPVATLWMDRVRSVKSYPNCHVFPNQWSTFIPTVEKINALWEKMKLLVNETNSGKYIKVGKIEIPDYIDPTVDQQALLNSLHFIFHKFEEDSAGQSNIDYNPLTQLNVEIHRLELMVSTYRMNLLTDSSWLACGFFLTAGFHDTVPIPKDLYLPYWNHAMQFGDMVLGYHTVGKNIQHCYNDNDIDLVRRGFVRPQTELGNEVQLVFPTHYHPDSTRNMAKLTAQWVIDNHLEHYVDMSRPENSVAGMPLLGRLEGNYTREYISNLFEHYKVADAELLQ